MPGVDFSVLRREITMQQVPVHFRTALLWRQATERCVRVASWVFLPAGANCWFAGRRGLGFFEGRQFRLEKRTTFDNPFFDFRE